jgi:hypothetical protein
MWRRCLRSAPAIRLAEEPVDPIRIPPTASDIHERSDHGAHLVREKRVSHNIDRDDRPSLRLRNRAFEDPPDGPTPDVLPLRPRDTSPESAEAGEIMLARKLSRRGCHRREIESLRYLQRVPALQRIFRPIADSVLIRPPPRVPSRIKSRSYSLCRQDRYVLRQERVQRTHQAKVFEFGPDILERCDLAERMHSCICPARERHRDRLMRQNPNGSFQLVLDCPPAWLPLRARELRSIVRDDQPDLLSR